MIMYEEYRDGIREKIEAMPPCIFKNHDLEKAQVLADNDTMMQLWALYQKSIEDYNAEPNYAARDALSDVLGIPCDVPFEFEMYALEVRVGGGVTHQTYGSLKELEEGLSKRLTENETEQVLPKLTHFTQAMVDAEEGYAKNKWRNFVTCAYPV